MHPLVQLFICYAVTAVSIAFVPPIPTIRLGAFGGVLACAMYGLLYIDRSREYSIWVEFCAECTCGVVLYANYFLLLMKVTPPQGYSRLKRLSWAIDLLSNPRGIGTTWQIKNLPPFCRKNPTYVPSRRSFIIQRIVGCVFFYAITKTFGIVNEKIYIANLQDGDYSEYKESILRRITDVSMRELFIRAWLPLDTLCTIWWQHQYLHCLVSAIAVILGDEPRRWPPLYGSIKDVYSLRQFWGYVGSFHKTTRLFPTAQLYLILLI
jgi:hypothetical protein